MKRTTAARNTFATLEFLVAVWKNDGPGTKTSRLYRLLRRALVEGIIPANAALPSSRDVARLLSVGRVTAINAYDLLIDEGLVEARPGIGLFASPELNTRTVSAARTGNACDPNVPLSQRAEKILAASGSMSTDLDRRLTNHALTIAPNLAAFPWGLWYRTLSQHARAYAEHAGEPADQVSDQLRTSLAAYLRQVRGLDCTHENVVITASTQQSLLAVALLLCDAGERVWIENPCHPGARDAFRACGLECMPIEVDHEGLACATDAPAPRLIYTTPSHQFPLGVTMSSERRRDLLDVAARAGAWLIEDHYDSEYRHAGCPAPSLRGPGSHDRVIHLGTFSRVMFADIGLAYLIAPASISERLQNLVQRLLRQPGVVQQAALTSFIQQGHFSSHIRRTRTLYRKHRSEVLNFLAAHLSPAVEVMGSDAGLHLTLRFPAGLCEQDILHRLAQRGVAIRPLSACAADASHTGLLIGYTHGDLDSILDALGHVCDLVGQMLQAGATRATR